jgi:molecular chaperone DnaK
MIGIDFGTTSSCVAVMEGGVPQVIPNQEGERTTPSVVAFTADGQRLIGRAAKLQAALNPEGTVFGVKRLIGRKFDSPECEAFRRFAPFKVVPAPNGDAHVQAGGRVYSPPEICSLVLGKMKAAAEEYLGETVEEAIITVPAYFNDSQRQATKDAGLIAGLKVSRIINEPTAAALAYGLKNIDKSGHFIAVYDLGGGTFDITILEMADGLYQVRATCGNTFLGGDDFDERLMSWLLSECRGEVGVELLRTPQLLVRLREAAERFKRELSSAEEVEIVTPFLPADAAMAGQAITALSRRQYEALTRDLLQQTVATCEQCLADAGMTPEQLDALLLVGGQSRAPGVVEVVGRIFGRDPNVSIHPHEAVAIGAAIQTGIIQGDVRDMVLLDVTPLTLGIETTRGTFTPIIERNSTIPTRRSRVFTTVADNQTRVEVHVLQGESFMAAYNKSLQKFEITNIPPAPRGKPQFEVGFEIDVNGIVSVEATDQATGRRQAITVHPSGGLSQANLNRLVDETRKRESEDKSWKEREAVVRQLDGLAANFMRAVQALQGQLTPEEQQKILDSIERAKRAHGGGSLEELKGVIAEMETAAGIIGQAMLRQGSGETPRSE